jgi:hypothetical protein
MHNAVMASTTMLDGVLMELISADNVLILQLTHPVKNPDSKKPTPVYII